MEKDGKRRRIEWLGEEEKGGEMDGWKWGRNEEEMNGWRRDMF